MKKLWQRIKRVFGWKQNRNVFDIEIKMDTTQVIKSIKEFSDLMDILVDRLPELVESDDDEGEEIDGR